MKYDEKIPVPENSAKLSSDNNSLNPPISFMPKFLQKARNVLFPKSRSSKTQNLENLENLKNTASPEISSILAKFDLEKEDFYSGEENKPYGYSYIEEMRGLRLPKYTIEERAKVLELFRKIVGDNVRKSVRGSGWGYFYIKYGNWNKLEKFITYLIQEVQQKS